MKKIYLAKPYDGTETFTSDECRFLHTMNLQMPRATLSITDDLNMVFEQIPDGMSQYFWYNGVEMEYVYPLENKVVSLSNVDFSTPIIQPFSYTKFQKSLLDFDKIIFLENLTAEHIIKCEGLDAFIDKFYVLDNYDGNRKPFLEYCKSSSTPFVKYYELANKLIDAIKNDNFSKLKYNPSDL